MMRCLVTGATGFVGRALVSELRASGAFVRGVARKRAPSEAHELVAADLSSLPPGSTICEQIDVVFHLAAKTHDMSEAAGVETEYRRVNVDGTAQVVAAASRSGVHRFVFVSSVKVFDEGNSVTADESTPAVPQTPYGRSKLEAEGLVRAAAAEGAFESVCLRFPLVYGPAQRGNLQRLIAAIERGRFPPPPRNDNRRSMLHVLNAVQALTLAANSPAAAGRTYIATDARPYSTREIYDAVRAGLGRPPARWAVPELVFRALAASGDVVRRLAGRRVGFDSDAFRKLLGSATYDSGLITRELGYQPRHDLIGSLPVLIAAQRAVR